MRSTNCLASMARRSKPSKTGSRALASTSVKVRSDIGVRSYFRTNSEMKHDSCAGEDVVLPAAAPDYSSRIVIAHFATYAEKRRDLTSRPPPYCTSALFEEF